MTEHEKTARALVAQWVRDFYAPVGLLSSDTRQVLAARIAEATTAAEARGIDRGWRAGQEVAARDEREACADLAECMPEGFLTEAGRLHLRTPQEMKAAIGAAIRKRGEE